MRDEAGLEDVKTAVLTTHEDDEYARAGEEDPRVFLTTSRNPSTRLVAFAKELKLVFPNAVRVNRGAQVSRRGSCERGGTLGVELSRRPPLARDAGCAGDGGVVSHVRLHRHCGGARAPRRA